MSWSGFARGTTKTMAAIACRYSGLQGLLCRVSRIASGGRRILILSYHRVVDDFWKETRVSIPGLLISKHTFQRHIEELTKGKFEIVPLEQALQIIKGGVYKRDVAVLTFDDGYQDVYEHAFPILKKKGIPATVYLASGFVGTKKKFLHDHLYHLLCLKLELKSRSKRRNVVAFGPSRIQAAQVVDQIVSTRSSSELKGIVRRLERQLSNVADTHPASGAVMTWSMASEMSKAGIQFGAHTESHTVLTYEDDENIGYELKKSKEDIEQNLNSRIFDFAYPNGRYESRVFPFLQQCGFRSAVTTEDLPNQVGINPLCLRRKTMWEDYSRGPFGYSSALTACHLDGVFTLLSLSKPVPGNTKNDYIYSVTRAQE